jgi:glycosyltransferase involved in cell wall biosynthesis
MINQNLRKSIIILVAWRLGNEKFWLQKELENQDFKITTLDTPTYTIKNRLFKWRKLILVIDYLKLGWRGIQLATHSGSIVIADHFHIGVLASLFTLLSKKRQPVIALNMIVHNERFFIRFLRKLVYQAAFYLTQIKITVNSQEVREQYIKTFGIRSENIFILHDAWLPNYKVSLPSIKDDEFVFSGGEAARDWETLLSVAAACPEIRFKVIARRISWNPRQNVPANVDVFFDTSEEEFYSMAARARLILLPLVDNFPAGLIVLIRSILLGKMVISTNTPAIECYYPQGCRDLLVPQSDPEAIISRLKHYWINPENRIEQARIVQNYVLHNFSPEAYANQVSDLIQKNFYSN